MRIQGVNRRRRYFDPIRPGARGRSTIHSAPDEEPFHGPDESSIQGETEMPLTLAAICAGAACLVIAVWFQRARAQHELERHSITPEVLHTLLETNKEVLLFDVRQPLDLLASSEIIPGAKRIPPRDVLENPSLIPQERDSVVYCTCPSDKTSRAVLHRALSVHFLHIKFLKGGLEAWKTKGYPVEPYDELIHLDIAT
jgi:rhodanese-related sulfurtransferase